VGPAKNQALMDRLYAVLRTTLNFITENTTPSTAIRNIEHF
jgi:hypothetical protein